MGPPMGMLFGITDWEMPGLVIETQHLLVELMRPHEMSRHRLQHARRTIEASPRMPSKWDQNPKANHPFFRDRMRAHDRGIEEEVPGHSVRIRLQRRWMLLQRTSTGIVITDTPADWLGPIPLANIAPDGHPFQQTWGFDHRSPIRRVDTGSNVSHHLPKVPVVFTRVDGSLLILYPSVEHPSLFVLIRGRFQVHSPMSTVPRGFARNTGPLQPFIDMGAQWAAIDHGSQDARLALLKRMSSGQSESVRERYREWLQWMEPHMVRLALLMAIQWARQLAHQLPEEPVQMAATRAQLEHSESGFTILLVDERAPSWAQSNGIQQLLVEFRQALIVLDADFPSGSVDDSPRHLMQRTLQLRSWGEGPPPMLARSLSDFVAPVAMSAPTLRRMAPAMPPEGFFIDAESPPEPIENDAPQLLDAWMNEDADHSDEDL